MKTTLSERLREAMAGPPKVTGIQLAKACKVAAASVSDWLSGKSKTMEANNLLAAARLLNVDPEWLANGVGVKGHFWKRVEQQPAEYTITDPTMTEAIQLLRQLNPDQLQEAVSFLKWKLSNTAPPRDGQTVSMAA